MSNNLIDTYVSEIGRRLPGKSRADIQAEIRSTLQDVLDERSRQKGKPVDEEMILQVLKEYGSPEKVASTYLGERYLVGPRLYPIFILVLRIVLIVTGVFATIGLVIALSHVFGNPQNAFGTILGALAEFGASIITALGYIILIFAILEWALFRAGLKVNPERLSKEKEWDPRTLAGISTPDQVKMGERIIEIFGCFAAIVIFNFYPQIIGFTPSLNGVSGFGNWAIGFGNGTFKPLLSAAFFHFVPYLTAAWGLTILLDIVLVRMGSWNVFTRISFITLKIINIVIAVAMLAAPFILALTIATLTTALGNANSAGILVNLLNQVVRVFLWLTIVASAIEIFRSSYRLFTINLFPQSDRKFN